MRKSCRGSTIRRSRRVGAALLLLGVASGAAGAPTEAMETIGPERATVERGYEPPRPGEPEPRPEMPGLSPTEESAARRRLAEYDAAVAAALSRADEAARKQAQDSLPHEVVPVPPVLPPVLIGPNNPIIDNRPLPHLSTSESQTSTMASCVGNCYQTDRVLLSDHPDDVYASDYLVWLAVPQGNETNKCDGSANASGCFWFYAMTYYTDCDYCNSAIHIGPQRGDSLAGSAGSQWRVNIDGYNDGSHVGGQSTVDLPVATWIRVRTWRVNHGMDSSAPYTPWATFGVWALANGTDTYLGEITIDGTNIASANMFAEVYEANGQCTTDLERGYLDNPTYHRGGSWYRFPSAIADYEVNCTNTSWLVEGAPDFIRDERETLRVVDQNEFIW